MNEWTNERMHSKIIICSFVYVSFSPTDKTLKSHRISSEEISAVSQTVLMFATIPKSADRNQRSQHFSSNSSKSPNDRSCLHIHFPALNTYSMQTIISACLFVFLLREKIPV